MARNTRISDSRESGDSRESCELIRASHATKPSAIDVRIDDLGSILKFRIGLPFGENSAGFCQSVWLSGSILKFRIGSVSLIGGSIAATLVADTISDPQILGPHPLTRYSYGNEFPVSESESSEFFMDFALWAPKGLSRKYARNSYCLQKFRIIFLKKNSCVKGETAAF